MKNLLKTVKLSLFVTASLSVISASLLAGNLADRGPLDFSSYDTNNDGFVTEQEFNFVQTKRMEEKASAGMPMKNAGNAPTFNLFDANNDGKITEIELLKGQNKQMQSNQQNRGMNQMNKGMGKNSSKNMRQGMNMPAFEDFDLNNDGLINSKEMEKAREKRMEQNASDGKMMKNINNQPTFSDLDINKDGNINKEEFLTHQMKQRQ